MWVGGHANCAPVNMLTGFFFSFNGTCINVAPATGMSLTTHWCRTAEKVQQETFFFFFKLQTRGLTPLCAPAPLLCDYQSLRYKSNNSTKRWTPGIIYFLPTGWRSHYWIAIQTHVKWISNPHQQVWWSPPPRCSTDATQKSVFLFPNGVPISCFSDVEPC